MDEVNNTQEAVQEVPAQDAGTTDGGSGQAGNIDLEALRTEWRKELQREVDRRVTPLVQEKKKLEDALKETERQSMTQTERQLAELAEWKRDKEAADRRSAILEALSRSGLGVDWADTITAPVESIGQAVESLKTRLENEAAKIAAARLRSVAPEPKGGAGAISSVTREDLVRMSPEKITELYDSGKLEHLYKK